MTGQNWKQMEASPSQAETYPCVKVYADSAAQWYWHQPPREKINTYHPRYSVLSATSSYHVVSNWKPVNTNHTLITFQRWWHKETWCIVLYFILYILHLFWMKTHFNNICLTSVMINIGCQLHYTWDWLKPKQTHLWWISLIVAFKVGISSLNLHQHFFLL